jgi:hypothetical protein
MFFTTNFGLKDVKKIQLLQGNCCLHYYYWYSSVYHPLYVYVGGCLLLCHWGVFTPQISSTATSSHPHKHTRDDKQMNTNNNSEGSNFLVRNGFFKHLMVAILG